jgi:hypothetical protein
VGQQARVRSRVTPPQPDRPILGPPAPDRDRELQNRDQLNRILVDKFMNAIAPFTESEMRFTDVPLGLDAITWSTTRDVVVAPDGTLIEWDDAVKQGIVTIGSMTGGPRLASGFTLREITEYWVDPELKPRDPFEMARIQAAAEIEARGYVAMKDMWTHMQAVTGEGYGPEYLSERDRYMTEQDALNTLYKMSVDELALVKTNLIRLGLLSETQAGLMSVRDINKKVEDAFLSLVGTAQQNDMKWDAFMGRMLNDGTSFGGGGGRGGGRGRGGGGGGGGYQIRLTNPDDLRQVANAVAQQRIGRTLDDDTLNRFVAAYQDLERQYQTQFQQGQSEVVQPPAVDTFAATMLSQQFASEEDVYKLGATLDMFTEMIR